MSYNLYCIQVWANVKGLTLNPLSQPFSMKKIKYQLQRDEQLENLKLCDNH